MLDPGRSTPQMRDGVKESLTILWKLVLVQSGGYHFIYPGKKVEQQYRVFTCEASFFVGCIYTFPQLIEAAVIWTYQFVLCIVHNRKIDIGWCYNKFEQQNEWSPVASRHFHEIRMGRPQEYFPFSHPLCHHNGSCHPSWILNYYLPFISTSDSCKNFHKNVQ